MEPHVCVVIPTRNRHELVRTALHSVLEQEGVVFEVVVVDEGSSPPISQTLGSMDARVRILRNEQPRGPAGARNQGAALSRSPFVAFLDDDDRWLPGKLRACLDCFAERPTAGLVFHGVVVEGAPSGGNGRWGVVDDPVRHMLTRRSPHLDAVVVRREFHEAVLFDEAFRAAEDLDYLLRVAEITEVVRLDQVLAVHGTGPDIVSDIGFQERIAGRRLFVEKHAIHFRDSKVRAFHYVRLGHLHRLAGRRLTAVGCFARALAARPSSLRAWKGLGASVLPGLLARR